MSQVCRRCRPGILHDDQIPLCPDHLVPLEPYVPAPAEPAEPPAPDAPGLEPATDESSCWNCGTPVPHPGNVECLNPECRKSLAPPALLIRFATGQVELGRGARVELGRLGPYAGLFRPYPNVSRHHAVVGTEPGGRAWIEPVPTPNGTFLDGYEIPASERRPLRSNHRIRFGLNAEGTVTVYSR